VQQAPLAGRHGDERHAAAVVRGAGHQRRDAQVRVKPRQRVRQVDVAAGDRTRLSSEATLPPALPPPSSSPSASAAAAAAAAFRPEVEQALLVIGELDAAA